MESTTVPNNSFFIFFFAFSGFASSNLKFSTEEKEA